MADLSKLKTTLATEPYAGLSADDAWPVYQAQTARLKPVVAADLFALLSPGSAGKLFDWPNLHLIDEAILANNHARLIFLATGLVAAGRITSDEATAIGQALQALADDAPPVVERKDFDAAYGELHQ